MLRTAGSIIGQETGKKLRTKDVMINTLDVRRAAEKTWLDDLNKAFMPCCPTAEGKVFDFFALQRYHDNMVQYAAKEIINGRDGNHLDSAGQATRAETAIMITRFHAAMEEQPAA